MGHRVLVASGEAASTVGSNGSTATFPPTGNIWNNRDVTGVRDVKILASFSASTNYAVRLVGSFEDPSSGSVFKGTLASFAPGDSCVNGSSDVLFRASGAQVHFEQIEVENSSAGSSMSVGQLGAVWRSHNG